MTVVSGGWQKSEPKISSKPTTLSPAGTAVPRCCSRCSTPMASRSLNATSAVDPLAIPMSAAAEPPASVGENGPRLSTSMPARPAHCDSARQRSPSAQAFAGPPR